MDKNNSKLTLAIMQMIRKYTKAKVDSHQFENSIEIYNNKNH